jgi:hypothetical protein
MMLSGSFNLTLEMMMSHLGQAGKALGMFAAWALLSGCGGDTEYTDDRQVSAAPDSVTVVIQLTGLMLVVRPEQEGGPTEILLPKTPGHTALIGFGITSDSYVDRLCISKNYPGLGKPARDARICYVDLEKWDLKPIGTAGSPLSPTISALPEGVLNLTRGSGDLYKVNILQVSERIRSQITFNAGSPGSTPCSLGQWHYDPVGEMVEKPYSLANVLHWSIRVPSDSARLVFTPKQRTGPDVVVSLDYNSKSVHVLLAHVPHSELLDLPPRDPETPNPSNAPERVTHFHALYDLLQVPDDSTRRPLPHTLKPQTEPEPCRVRITTFQREKRWWFTQKKVDKAGGLKTHGCMLAAAEPEP